MGNLRVTAREMKGVTAFMVTPVKEMEVTNRSENVVNLDEAARAADALVRDGVSGLTINSTFGEVAALTWDEAKAFTGAVIDSVRDRVPVFAGVTQLNTRDTIMRARAYVDMGATGLLAGRPMFAPMSDQNTIQHFTDLAAAVPNTAIMLYENPEAFKRAISTVAYKALAKIPNIVCAKYKGDPIVGAVFTNTYESDMEACGDNIKLMTLEADWLFAHRVFGTDACWSSYVNCGPSPALAIQKAIETQQWDTAKAITKDLTWAQEGMIRNNNFGQWLEDKIPFMKRRFEAAGYIKTGPVLPPYQYITPERDAYAQELGRRGAKLQAKYARTASVAAA
jgi:4-(2-carboxyphenyl)-2-oxobut-3-enoate aldolase